MTSINDCTERCVAEEACEASETQTTAFGTELLCVLKQRIDTSISTVSCLFDEQRTVTIDPALSATSGCVESPPSAPPSPPLEDGESRIGNEDLAQCLWRDSRTVTSACSSFTNVGATECEQHFEMRDFTGGDYSYELDDNVDYTGAVVAGVCAYVASPRQACVSQPPFVDATGDAVNVGFCP